MAAAEAGRQEVKSAQMTPPPVPPAAGSDPLASERFKSQDELRQRLIEMGPGEETYRRVFDLVGPGNEDAAKDALGKFFQGSVQALASLYHMLVENDKANAVDQNIVTEIMQMHPELQPEGQQPKAAESSKPIEKTAGAGGVGGGGNVGYIQYGPDEKRYCPKLKNVVNCFVCRYHCLDGLPIDDHQILCGEAIWRQSIMDKFTRPYKDKDGNWVGGYIKGRFHVEENTAGNSYQLKPGQRGRPIKEQAWSTEKRLAEMRKEDGEDRGYEGIYEPEGLYNFDQHELHPGPENVELEAKERDPIAKNSSVQGETKTAAADPFVGKGNIPPEYYEVQPEELAAQPSAKYYLDKKAGKVLIYGYDANDPADAPVWGSAGEFPKGPFNSYQEAQAKLGELGTFSSTDKRTVLCKKKSKVKSPWAVCHTVDKDKNPEKYERCVQDVKRKSKKSFNLRSVKSGSKSESDRSPRVFRLRDRKAGTLSDPSQAASVSQKRCPMCGDMKPSPGMTKCPKCGRPLLDVRKDEARAESGAIKNPPGGELGMGFPRAAITMINGVYKAAKGPFVTYGETPQEAERKLLEKTPEAVGQESQDISKIMQEPQAVPVQPQAQPVPAAAPVVTQPTKQEGTVPAEEVDRRHEVEIAARKAENPIEQQELDDLADSVGLGVDETSQEGPRALS